jgi:hypothetical protein
MGKRLEKKKERWEREIGERKGKQREREEERGIEENK